MINPKELYVWQKSKDFVKEIYLMTKKFPKEELFGLSMQIRRAVVSIVSNIAEGSGRNSNNDFAHFLDIAMGSAYEVETQIIISFELNYIDNDEFIFLNTKIIEIQKMINGLKLKVRASK
ncbi:MAG: four helix bundle protein [Prevotellaceae bacterium]|jgi:four helix bundle protein|nr:four helix bundle protein [Prevotellaceae bacterium]